MTESMMFTDGFLAWSVAVFLVVSLLAEALPWWFWSLLLLIVFGGILWAAAKFFSGRVFFTSEKLKRIVQVTAGFGFWSSTSWVFDNIAYPGVIAWRGLVEGGLIMSVTAILITAIFLIVYEWKKVDWMGMDALRSVRDNGDVWIAKFEDKGRRGNPIVRSVMRAILFFPVSFFRVVLWMLNKGDAFAFVGLSLVADPFVTTIYLRHGRFDGLRKKDWAIFLASGVLANFYWTLRSYGVVVIIRYFWNMFA